MRTEQEKTDSPKIADFADKTLLIVDDDDPLRSRLARAMEKKGFQVIQAESVKTGITLAKKCRYQACTFGQPALPFLQSKFFL